MNVKAELYFTVVVVAVIDCRYTSKRGVTDCDSKTCDYVLTYRVLEGEIAQFEMSARAQWAGVGFSSDDRMVYKLSLIHI